MPIYEYECERCGHVIEEFFPIIPKTIPETVVRPCCHSEDGDSNIRTFKRRMSTPNFHLKPGGVGWAKDGYDKGSQDGSRVVSLTEPK